MQDIGILAALIAGVWGLLLWLSIIVWVYRDIRERTRDLGKSTRFRRQPGA